MAKIIPKLEYRQHCIRQGRDGIEPLTRKQQKALRQHREAMARDDRPSALMIVEEDNSTDPYNSGVFRALRPSDVLFLLDGKPVIGDMDTIVPDYWRGS